MDPPVDVVGARVVVVPFALTCTSPSELSASAGVGDPAQKHSAAPGARLGSPLGVLGHVIGGTTGGALGAPVGINGDVGTVGVDVGTVGVDVEPVDPPDDPVEADALGVGVGVGSAADPPPLPPPLASVVNETTGSVPLVFPPALVASAR